MPQITIDGQIIEAKEGQHVIDVALENGIDVPHFCWHPGMSVAGNCRMCLAEVGNVARDREGNVLTDEDGNPEVRYIPKLQIACATPVADGMHVRIDTPKVKEAQEAVMEFLLINHPLDCPICDEAGQCKLQEYAFNHSKGESRFEEAKNHKDKRRPLGPRVLFDGERCISCSRCIRFAEEVAEQPHLTFVQRGDHVTIETFEDKEFDSPYSMNVIEICPVGALTDPEFRFKARVWDMTFNDSICTGCAKGCNTKIGVRNNEALRIEPRVNMEVNEYWMCDSGRSRFNLINENRLEEPIVRTNGETTEVEWKEAIAKAAELLKGVKPNEICVIASPRATNEDNFALKRFASEVVKTNNIDSFQHFDESQSDSFLRCADKSPNTKGLLALGIKNVNITTSSLAKDISSGKIKALYVMNDNIANLHPDVLKALDSLNVLIVHSSHDNALAKKAHVVFPEPTFAELEGTYTNEKQRVQYVSPAIVTAENERSMGMKMSRLDKFGAFNDRWTHGERRNCRQPWRVLRMLSRELGAKDWGYKTSEDVFTDMTKSVQGFDGMNYDMIQERNGVVVGEAHKEYIPIFEYDSHYMKPD
jgi:NADH-quinone oxidoreductase subunit G